MIAFQVVVIAVISASQLFLVQGKRQKPRHDEIERVINDTHSFIWKCSNSECPPGSGLNVQCGISIPISIPIRCVFCVKGVNYSNTQDYSTCKSCKNCGEHENKEGECTPEDDKTNCLGTCYKGFYKDKITEDCHPCSNCCGEGDKHHEKQCEDAGLPPKQQCRRTNVKCHHPTKAGDSERKDQQREHQGSLQALEIAAIVLFSTIAVIIIVFLVFWWFYGWERVKNILKKYCCCCCQLVQSTGGNESDKDDLESTFCNVNGSQLTEYADELGTLSSDPLVMTAERAKRPLFQRLLSVPVETQSDFQSKMPRSFSHPGCLNKLANKHTKKGYTLVATEPPEIDDLLGEDLGKDHLVGTRPFSSGEFFGKSVQSGDFVAQVPGTKTSGPTELPGLDHLPANNLCKQSFIKPTSSGAYFPGHFLQSVGSTVKDLCKNQSTGVEKPSAKDQCTSTTELHLPSTTQVADIPQEFQNCLLSKKMSAIPIKFYSKICKKLDITRHGFWDDFRMLAEKVGLDKDHSLWLGQRGNPTELIIQKFDSQENSSIGWFKTILKEMERYDVVTIIEEWVKDEWYKHNNCGKGYKLQSFV